MNKHKVSATTTTLRRCLFRVRREPSPTNYKCLVGNDSWWSGVFVERENLCLFLELHRLLCSCVIYQEVPIATIVDSLVAQHRNTQTGKWTVFSEADLVRVRQVQNPAIIRSAGTFGTRLRGNREKSCAEEPAKEPFQETKRNEGSFGNSVVR